MFVRTTNRISLGFAAMLGLATGACNNDKGGGLDLIDRGSCDVLSECAASLAPESHNDYELG